MTLKDFQRAVAFLALAISLPLALSAAGPVVAEGANGIRITVDDLNADALRLPASQRYQALVQPAAVEQVSLNLYIRRVLAAEATRDGLDKDPVTAAAMQLARERILSDARLARIDAANKPTDEAVEAAARAAYNANPEKFRAGAEVRARHILLQGNTDKGREAAEKVLQEVKSGADFAKVALEKSQDTGSAQRGGDLGWFGMGRMVPEFEDAVNKLKNPGDVSDLVRTQFGWHIIKLEGRRDAGPRSYADVREELRAMVTNQLQSDVRLREAKRIAETFKPDRTAIEAFSATHKK